MEDDDRMDVLMGYVLLEESQGGEIAWKIACRCLRSGQAEILPRWPGRRKDGHLSRSPRHAQSSHSPSMRRRTSPSNDVKRRGQPSRHPPPTSLPSSVRVTLAPSALMQGRRSRFAPGNNLHQQEKKFPPCMQSLFCDNSHARTMRCIL